MDTAFREYEAIAQRLQQHHAPPEARYYFLGLMADKVGSRLSDDQFWALANTVGIPIDDARFQEVADMAAGVFAGCTD